MLLPPLTATVPQIPARAPRGRRVCVTGNPRPVRCMVRYQLAFEQVWLTGTEARSRHGLVGPGVSAGPVSVTQLAANWYE
jgi:hypothetical protein